MEVGEVEFVSEFLLGFCSQLQDFQLADFVGECLAGPGDVSVDFVFDVVHRLGRVDGEKVNRLVSSPAFVVDAGVDNQPDSSPHVVGQLAESRVRIFVETQLVTEPLGVQTPAFDERRVATVAPKLRQAFEFLRDRDLQVMSRHGLVYGQDFHFVFGSRVRTVEVHEVGSAAGSVCGWRPVVSGGRVRGEVFRNRLEPVRNLWQPAEHFRQQWIDAPANCLVLGHQFVGILVVVPRVGAEVFEELVEGALEPDFLDDLFHLGPNACDLGQPDVVNLVRSEVGRRELSCFERVELASVRNLSEAGFLETRRQIDLFEKQQQLLISG